MDIEYLLLLQNFRQATGDVLTPLMEAVTELAASPLLIGLVAFVYWAVNKPLGSFLMLNYTGSTLLNQTVKLGVCAYRPWVRDARVIPVASAIGDATGYSFPSGHSQSATAYYGSIALWFGKKRRWVAWPGFPETIWGSTPRRMWPSESACAASISQSTPESWPGWSATPGETGSLPALAAPWPLPQWPFI